MREQTEPPQPPRLLRQGEAAAYLGVHVNTIIRMMDRGELPVVRLSPKGWRMIDRHDLDAYIEQQKAVAG